jgi:hypothetical protein
MLTFFAGSFYSRYLKKSAKIFLRQSDFSYYYPVPHA